MRDVMGSAIHHRLLFDCPVLGGHPETVAERGSLIIFFTVPCPRSSLARISSLRQAR
jgi:hypothetical protein